MKTFQLRLSLLVLLMAIAVVLIAHIAAQIYASSTTEGIGLSDFEAFHIAGTMIWEHGAASPYSVEKFVEAQSQIPGFDGLILLWSYPPTFSMVVTVLAFLPAWLSYCVFTIVTLSSYLWVVRKISGIHYHLLLIVILPLLSVEIRSGQNGLLTGFLIGLTCSLGIRSSTKAGIPLGLMVIKPHLGLGLGLTFLIRRLWAPAGVSILVAILTCLISAILLTPGSWVAFIEALKETGNTLTAGGFPRYRLASTFATARSFGLSSNPALVLHFSVLALLISGLIILVRRGANLRHILGFGVIISAMFSPYTYDYDTAMLAVSVALVIDSILKHGTLSERRILLIGAWFVGLYSSLAVELDKLISEIFNASEREPIALIGPTVVLMAFVLFNIILRTLKLENNAAS